MFCGGEVYRAGFPTWAAAVRKIDQYRREYPVDLGACVTCRRRPRWAGSQWCEGCYRDEQIVDGTIGFTEVMRRAEARQRGPVS